MVGYIGKSMGISRGSPSRGCDVYDGNAFDRPVLLKLLLKELLLLQLSQVLLSIFLMFAQDFIAINSMEWTVNDVTVLLYLFEHFFLSRSLATNEKCVANH